MEKHLKDFEMENKNPLEQTIRRWRNVVALVKNPRRRFRFVVDLAKRSEAEKKNGPPLRVVMPLRRRRKRRRSDDQKNEKTIGGRYMAYSPSPSEPHSPHLSSLRSAFSSAALVAVEKEKYLSKLLGERHKERERNSCWLGKNKASKTLIPQSTSNNTYEICCDGFIGLFEIPRSSTGFETRSPRTQPPELFIRNTFFFFPKIHHRLWRPERGTEKASIEVKGALH
ncbi:hypothetical protein ACFX2I_037223 [Malus domestica]